MVAAFAPTSSVRSKSSLGVSVDPEVVTKKEYEDICGVNFDQGTLEERLKKTSFLYPKHVEVISDFEPLVDQLVDDIVSSFCLRVLIDVFYRNLILDRNCVLLLARLL
jgi:hypothetical protein